MSLGTHLPYGSKVLWALALRLDKQPIAQDGGSFGETNSSGLRLHVISGFELEPNPLKLHTAQALQLAYVRAGSLAVK